MSPRKKAADEQAADDRINEAADALHEAIASTSNDPTASATALAAVGTAREWGLAAAAVNPEPEPVEETEPQPEDSAPESADAVTSMPPPDGGGKKDIPVDPNVNRLDDPNVNPLA